MTVFDLGANTGEVGFQFLEKSAIVYAFEPTPELCQKIMEQAKDKTNYHLIQAAVSDVNGKKKFMVAGQADWGCSSLYGFSDHIERTWPGRTDLKVTDEITVQVISLLDFIVENNITTIDYYHSDIQGNDLHVLKSLGDMIHIIKEGAIEVSAEKETALYEGPDNTLESAKEYLISKGFKITHLHPQQNEYNLHFKK